MPPTPPPHRQASTLAALVHTWTLVGLSPLRPELWDSKELRNFGSPLSMSQREARESTTSQRTYYTNLSKKATTAQTIPTGNQVPLVDGVQTIMADSNPKGQSHNGGAQPGVPAGNDTTQVTPDVDHETQHEPQPGTSDQDNDSNTDVRLKNIEEILLDWKKDKEKQKAMADRSRRSSRHTRSPSRSRRPSRHSGYSPSGRRSRSSRRSHSRHSSRRRSSRSRSRRRTRSRSRHRGRSLSRRRSRRSSSRGQQRSFHTDRHTQQRQDPKDGANNELERALKSQYPDMGRPKGKPLPTYAVSPEPYRRLPPDLKSNASERRSRRDLTFPEHMCGLLSMVLKHMDDTTEAYGAIEHAAQVAEDAASVGWPDVRTWSQACMAHIEDGAATWTERAAFDRARTKLSWVKGKSKHEIKVPCHDFNTTKCAERDTHHSEGRTWMHTCSICFYGMDDDDTSHTAKRCKAKSSLRSYRDDARRENRWRHDQHSKRDNKPNAAGATTNNNNKSKN